MTPDTRTTENPDLICAACGQTDSPVVEVPLHPRCAEAAQGAAPLTCDNCGHTMDWRCHPPQGAAPRAEGLAEHITDFLDPLSCWCRPYRDNDEPQVIIHRKDGALASILDETKGGPWKPDDGTSLWFYNEAGDQIRLTGDDVLLLLNAAHAARSTPAEALPLRAALERLLAVAMTEEEDVSPATQDEWIAAIKQANEALDHD